MSFANKSGCAGFFNGFWRTIVSAPLAVLAVVASLAYSTSKLEPPVAARKPLLVGAQIPSQVLSSIQRACQNCHSPNTSWPWYSEIPPISWQIHKDVAQARQFMDLSRWNQYSDSERRGYLVSIAAVLKSSAMPPRRYVWIHPEARLSDAELAALEEWALSEQQRLRSVTAPGRIGLGSGD
jgi:cytochrome c551/c552